MTKTETIINHILELPALPSIVARLLEIIDQPETSAHRLAKLVSSDPALTAKILRVANSSYYSFNKKIHTVQLAISLIGYDTISNLVLSISFFGHFASQNFNDNFIMSKYWEHCLIVSIIAKKFAQMFAPDLTSDIFTIGILHDIGKLIIRQYLNDEYQQIEKLQQEEKCSSIVAEEKILKLNHSQVGAILCKNRKMPQEIITAIASHHNPQNSRHSAIIYLSDYFANILGFSFPKVVPDFDLSQEKLTNIIKIINHSKESTDLITDKNYYLKIMENEIEEAGEFISLLYSI